MAKAVASEEFEVDSTGRIKYHPDLHPMHRKPFTRNDLIYLCKFHEIDGLRTISLALGRPETALATKIGKLKSAGLYEQYKKEAFIEGEMDWI